jgi:uncharacterized protein (TIGR02646 family)
VRPICKGASPRPAGFTPYADALPYLVSRLGNYCSYCERSIVTNLAVEHIQPKSLEAYAHLVGEWGNYLLGCVNCNSTKKNKNVVLADVLLPDRDNTFAAFDYLEDGTIQPSQKAVLAGLGEIAKNTLTLTGLDKTPISAVDENEKLVALDRISQRKQAWILALNVKNDLETQPKNITLRNWLVVLAKASGFFSIWMAVFAHDQDMRQRLIKAFQGTLQSGCFDANGTSISPAPNINGLANGGKI